MGLSNILYIVMAQKVKKIKFYMRDPPFLIPDKFIWRGASH